LRGGAIQTSQQGQRADLRGDQDEHYCSAGKQDRHDAMHYRERESQWLHE